MSGPRRLLSRNPSICCCFFSSDMDCSKKETCLNNSKSRVSLSKKRDGTVDSSPAGPTGYWIPSIYTGTPYSINRHPVHSEFTLKIPLTVKLLLSVCGW